MTSSLLLGILIGFILGAAASAFFFRRSKEQSEKVFEQLSAKVLNQSMEQLVTVAEKQLAQQVKLNSKELDTKKQLIDANLKVMNEGLNKVESMMQEVGKQNTKVETRLTDAAKVITELNQTAGNLKNALSSNSSRGQWGERMAEDVLRLSGLLEGVNYTKQQKIDSAGTKPDFTFMLPQQLKLNMDVKFPFNNYQQFVDAKTDKEREEYKKEFLKDIRNRIKEVRTRDYINPEENTVDYMLLFIPNEQIYTFLQETDKTLIDEAMQAKTILCSPLTLYAILSVVRQSIDNFTFESKSREMLNYLSAFKTQWVKFKDSMKTVGDRLQSVQNAYTDMVTTRSNQLEKPLEKLDDMRATADELTPAIVAKATVERVLPVGTKKAAEVEA